MDKNDDDTSDNTSDSFEAAFFSSSPFLRNLGAFVRRGTGSDAAAVRSGVVPCEKPVALTSLSPEVLARLRCVDDAVANAAANAQLQQSDRSTSSTEPAEPLRVEAPTDDEEGHLLVGEDARIEWSRVRISPDHDDGGDEGEGAALAEGARLAVACHAALQRRNHQQYQQGRERRLLPPPRLPGEQSDRTPGQLAAFLGLPFSEAMPGVYERIVAADSDDEQVYLALCVCLIVLERALYDIYRVARGRSGSRSRTQVGERGFHANGKADGADGGSQGSIVAPVMILRDLIATPEIEAALPEQMVAVLRLLLLPKGFNIRNLVWHGFLAPHELPRELASLVLVVTLSIPAGPASPRVDTTSFFERAVEEWEPQQAPSPSRQPPQSQPQPPLRTDPSQRASWWALDSFDDRLAVPPALISAVGSLLSDQHRDELDALVRRSAFVLPGREHMSMLSLSSLLGGGGGGGGGRGEPGSEQGSGDGAAAVFLVAVLPVLEHGLRCLFSCANDSPGHLFAHLRRYYSTLDGFGQKARHQLLLDQEISGRRPGRKNLLLAALGPGLSACLLDLFMMSAGPNLRGKVAHGEMDMSRVFPRAASCSRDGSRSPSSSSLSVARGATGGGESAGGVETRSTRTPVADVVKLTAAVFLVLCRRYENAGGDMAGDARAGESGACVVGSGGGNPLEHGSGNEPDHAGRSRSSSSSPGEFADALAACERLCSGWVPRFHPHELLEADLRASRDEFDSLALALRRRVVSIEVLPGGDLARMSVAISADDIGVDQSGVTSAARVEAEMHATVSPPDTQMRVNEDGKQRQGGGAGEVVPPCAEGNEEQGVVVLSLTDTTSRLVPPPSPSVTEAIDGAGGLPTTSPEHDGSSSKKPPRSNKKNDRGAASNGVFSSLLRIERALQAHAAGMAHRFARSGSSGSGSGSGNGNSSTHGAAVGEAPRPSAFAPFYSKPSARMRPDAASSHVISSDLCHEARAAKQDTSAGDKPRSEHAAAAAPCPTDRRLTRDRTNDGRRRISPETNVITAVPLPAVARMSGLCGACAGVASGLRGRIGELEALLRAGSARSGQRRAYAATVQVAPTLLRFLALSVAAVELFVVEWDRRHGGRAHDAVDGGGSSAGRSAESSSSMLSSASGPAAAAADEGDDGGAAPADFAFLARLAGVNGALGLCVADPGSTTTTTSCGSSSSSSSSSCRMDESESKAAAGKKTGGAGKKGFAQALVELASFLETRAARRGFGGR